MTVTGQRISHSRLLTAEENQTVASLVGHKCQALATTVAQVYQSEGPGHSYRWNKRTCGVVCFVKDNGRRSYFIRVFDLDRNVLVYDQEIYTQFRYKSPRPYFHTFEGDEAQIGLNFADEDEADLFQKTVESKLAEKRDRRERKQAMKRQQMGSNGVVVSGAPTNGGSGVNTGGTQPNIQIKGVQGAGGKKGDKRKLKKEDIGMPTNFQHISHVGWDPNHGFDLENVDPNLKKFFQKAGVDEKALQDKDTREFIYDFIDKHGGVEAALREVNTNTAPPPPRRTTTTAPPPPVNSRPPPPSRTQVTAPGHRAPPPPAPKQSTPAPPPPPPPPPPPTTTPLMSQMSETLRAPPAAPTLPPPDDSHSSLMDEIRKGGTLRHVSPEKTARPALDSRGELMGQIRQGVALKKVEEKDSVSEVSEVATGPGIAGMLQRALQERGMAMGMSSSDEDTDEEEDEWDD